MIKEFKEFVSKGNVIDLAVGVIIGGAFGKIVSSLVDNILMPLIGLLLGGINFSDLSVKINDTVLNYGLFIQNVVDFLIIALCVFFIVKAVNKSSVLVIYTTRNPVMQEPVNQLIFVETCRYFYFIFFQHNILPLFRSNSLIPLQAPDFSATRVKVLVYT